MASDNSTPKILSPTSRLTAGVDFGVHGIEVTISVDRGVEVGSSIMPAGLSADSVVEVAASTAFGTLGDIQGQKYVNAAINMTAVLDEKSIPVMMADLTLQVGKGYKETMIHMVSQHQRMAELRTDIYKTQFGGDYKSEDPAGSIANRCRVILDDLIKKWSQDNSSKEIDQSAEDKEIAERIHRTNQVGLGIWQSILTNSDTTTKIPEIEAAGDGIKMSIADFIRQLYAQGSSNFLSTMQAINSAFGLIYIPSTDAANPYGHLERVSVAFLGDPKERELIVEGFGSAFAPARNLPVTSVLITGSGITQFKPAKLQNDASIPPEKVMVIWPEQEPVVGQTLFAPPPPWIPVGDALAAGEDVEPPSGAELTADAYKTEVAEKRLALVDVTQEEVRAILKIWARDIYVDSTIAGDSISVTQPLDITWETGKRYKLTNRADGSSYFTGFLQSVKHHLVKNERGAGQADTSLTFTHVEAGDFELPFKE